MTINQYIIYLFMYFNILLSIIYVSYNSHKARSDDYY